ncbi:MAG: amidohydrolase family protein [Candidatus Acidiferrales bacterium]
MRTFGVKLFLFTSLVSSICNPAFAQQHHLPASSEADLLIVNGNVLTGEGLYSGTPQRVSAFAIRDGLVMKTGDEKEILKLRGRKTEVIDLRGAFVMPGFNDAHLHLASGGFEKLNVDLVGVKSLEEMRQRIAARVKTAHAGEWISGRGWDHLTWNEQVLPTRQDLDLVTGDHPAIFTRVDGHIAVANSAALKAAGITKDTAGPAGGKIDKDANGDPTGILREGARDAVYDAIPKPTAARRREALELALAEAARWGLTSLQDNSSWDDFLLYEQLEREQKLTARITEWLPFDAPVDTLESRRAHHHPNDPMLHTGMLKGFMDGSLGSRTAALLGPYTDDTKNSGLPQYDQATLNRLARERARAGFQLGFHAIGDRAVQMALDAFDEALRDLGGDPKQKDRRFRVEHAQVVTAEEIERFARLGVVASMQPNHLLTDMNWAVDRVGPERAKYSYAWRAFLDAGVALAFGTDYPVEPLTPFRGLYAAVTRKNEEGTKEYFPGQRLTIDEAIAAYTQGAAYAEFAEKHKGKIAPGYLADFVVLDRNITEVSAPEILQTRVLRTVVGGKTVYKSE